MFNQAVLRSGSLVVALLVACLGHPALAAEGTTRSAARQLGTEGVQAYQAGDYASAVEKLERAYGALPVPSLALWSARALERTGKLVEASERYLEAVRGEVSGDRELQAQAKKDAAAEREQLLPRIPTLSIHVEGPSCEKLELLLNGQSLSAGLVDTPLPTNPGPVTVVARCSELEATETIELAEATQRQVALRLTPTQAAKNPAPSPATVPSDTTTGKPSRWQPTAGWISIGVGGAGIVLGAIMGGVALGKVSELGCDSNGACPGATDDELASANTLRTVSTVGFIAGGILTAAGVTLLLIPPPRADAAYVTPYLTASSIGLRGAF